MSLSNFQNLSNTRSVCRVTLERATSASIVPQAVIEQEAGGNVEMRDLQLRKNFGGEKDTENYTFRWQEKVYSDVSTAVSDLKIRSWSCRVSWKLKEPFEVLVVRSPFRAKHYVVVQYMAAGLKCPLSPSPLPPPPPVDSMSGRRQGGQGRIDEQGRIDDITNAARDFALQLPWALLLVFFIAARSKLLVQEPRRQRECNSRETQPRNWDFSVSSASAKVVRVVP